MAWGSCSPLSSASALLSVISTARETTPLEVFAALLFDILHSDPTPWGPLPLLLARLAAPFLVRVSFAAAVLMHEWAHLLLASLRLACCQSSMGHRSKRIPWEGLWSGRNLSGNVPLRLWIRVLHPFSPMPETFSPHVTLPEIQTESLSELELLPETTPQQNAVTWRNHYSERSDRCHDCRHPYHHGHDYGDHCVRMMGAWATGAQHWGPWAISVVMSVHFTLFYKTSSFPSHDADSPLVRLVLESIACGFWMAALGSTATDLLGMEPLADGGDKGEKRLFCGNFGMLVISASREARKAATAAMEVLEEMCDISSERGGQSGGLVTFLLCGWGKKGLRVRVTPGKRESLAKKLLGRFRLHVMVHYLWRAIFSGPLALLDLLKFKKARQRQAQASTGVDVVESCVPQPTALSGSGRGAGVGKVAREGARAEDGEGAGQDVVQLFAGHTRFATSSIPTSGETHPHQWCPRHAVRLWRVGPTSGMPELVGTHSEIYITHNGDFEFFSLFGRDRTHSELGPWLEAVLGVRQPAHCDSVMIAGLMDLLRTQGMWAGALRLAYHQSVVTSYEEVLSAPGMVPSTWYWEALGRVCDDAFRDFVEKWQHASGASSSLRGIVATPGARPALEEALVDALRSQDAQQAVRTGGRAHSASVSFLQDLSIRALEAMVAQAVDCFLDNDVFGAVRHFFTRAKGSFGLSVSSALDGDRIVLAALNQCLSVGFAPCSGAVLYSSESFSLTVPLSKYFRRRAQGVGPREDLGHAVGVGGGNSDVMRVEYRLDLDEGEGEVLEISLRSEGILGGGGQGTDGESKHERRWRAGAEPMLLPELPGVVMRLHSIRNCRLMTAGDIRKKHRLVGIHNNPAITLKAPKDPSADLVACDLRDVPRVLETIRQDWQNRDSLNRRAAAALVEMLHAKAAAMSARGGSGAGSIGSSGRAIDVLVTGAECSLWVGEQFAADLQNCFPQLRVVPMSANKVIGVMGNARGAISASGFSICRMVSSLSPKEAIIIAISQSGQTFPTLHATRILEKHCPGRVFVVVGMLDSKMAGAVGQSLDPSSPPSCRVFHTHSGWRSAEPASATVAATHATLTELLLYAAKAMRSKADLALPSSGCDSEAEAAARARASPQGLPPNAGVRQPSQGAPNPNLPPSSSGELQAQGQGQGQWQEQGQMQGQEHGQGLGQAEEQGQGKQLAQGKEQVQEQEQEQEQRQGQGEQESGAGSAKSRQGQVRPLGLRLSERDIWDLERMRDAAVLRSVPDIAGCDAEGRMRRTEVNDSLRAQGLQWALHIMETPTAWVLSAAYIFGTVIAGWPLATAIRRGAGAPDKSSIAYVALAIDSYIYMFLPLIMALLLRILTARQLFARIGKRTLVIADVPYVHQVLEEFVSKLFALSFWIASIEVHGANPIDHFVHRFTHRVTRGTLIALGRPDGRLCSQTKCESWVLMALLQARTIVNLWRTGAEAITLGHNPYTNPGLIRRHVTLPSNRPKFLCEKLLGVDEDEPNKRLATRGHVLQTAAGGVHNTFKALDSEVIGMHLCDEGTVGRARQRGLCMLHHGLQGRRRASEDNADDPSTREALLCAMQLDVRAALQSQVGLEDFCENRFLSLERLLAFQVMFHRMASAVASLPFISFDITRSQSRLRIATTAAPISAADLEREWLDSITDSTVYQGHQGYQGFRQGEGSSHSHRLWHGNTSMHRISDALHAMFHKATGQSHHGGSYHGSSYHGQGMEIHPRSRQGGGSYHGGAQGARVSPNVRTNGTLNSQEISVEMGFEV